MLRRSFLKALAALPVVGKLVKETRTTPTIRLADTGYEKGITPSACLTSGKITSISVWPVAGRPVYYDAGTDSFVWSRFVDGRWLSMVEIEQAVKEGVDG